METIITRKRWCWIGHVLRKDANSITEVAIQWTPEGKQKCAQPMTTWWRTVEAEVKNIQRLASDRHDWRSFVAALYMPAGMTGSNEKKRNDTWYLMLFFFINNNDATEWFWHFYCQYHLCGWLYSCHFYHSLLCFTSKTTMLKQHMMWHQLHLGFTKRFVAIKIPLLWA